jgi:hypothetical protein
MTPMLGQERELRRQNIAEEILETEKSYVQGLEVLVRVFLVLHITFLNFIEIHASIR